MKRIRKKCEKDLMLKRKIGLDQMRNEKHIASKKMKKQRREVADSPENSNLTSSSAGTWASSQAVGPAPGQCSGPGQG
jgi:hypothetical protein